MSCIPLKESLDQLYKSSLEITVLERLLGVTPEETSNALDRKMRKTAIIVDKSRKPDKIRENAQTAQGSKTEKPQFGAYTM